MYTVPQELRSIVFYGASLYTLSRYNKLRLDQHFNIIFEAKLSEYVTNIPI